MTSSVPDDVQQPLTAPEMLEVLICARVYVDEGLRRNQVALDACRSEEQRVAFGHRREQERLTRLDGLVRRAIETGPTS